MPGVLRLYLKITHQPPEGGKHEKEEKRKAYMEINRRNRKISISIKYPVLYWYAIDGR
jgi:hypothetical protein